jgi:hypothetical protein
MIKCRKFEEITGWADVVESKVEETVSSTTITPEKEI